MAKKQMKGLLKKWYFWAIVVGLLIIIGFVVIRCFDHQNPTQMVTICTQMDYQGDIGPCVEHETVEIEVVPENQTDCPAGTEPVYDVVGGFVGIRFVGCTKSK